MRIGLFDPHTHTLHLRSKVLRDPVPNVFDLEVYRRLATVCETGELDFFFTLDGWSGGPDTPGDAPRQGLMGLILAASLFAMTRHIPVDTRHLSLRPASAKRYSCSTQPTPAWVHRQGALWQTCLRKDKRESPMLTGVEAPPGITVFITGVDDGNATDGKGYTHQKGLGLMEPARATVVMSPFNDFYKSSSCQ